MADEIIDELAPIDYVVIEFPPGISNFTGEIADVLADLVDQGTIRVLDLLILTKDAAGEVEAFELEDLDQVNALSQVQAQAAEILAAEDVANLAAAMEPGTTAGVLVYENTWAAPFVSAVRRAGGLPIANGRIGVAELIASLELELEAELEEDLEELEAES